MQHISTGTPSSIFDNSSFYAFDGKSLFSHFNQLYIYAITWCLSFQFQEILLKEDPTSWIYTAVHFRQFTKWSNNIPSDTVPWHQFFSIGLLCQLKFFIEDHRKDTQLQNLLTIPRPLDFECLIEAMILYTTSALDGYILLFQIQCNEILSVDECFSHIHIDINISLRPCGFSYLLTCVDHFFCV